MSDLEGQGAGRGSFVLGVDLDGVCGDYTAAFRNIVAAERGVDPSSLGDVRDWEFTAWGVAPEAWDDLHRRAVVEHRLFRTMPVMPHAAETLWRLSDMGVWIRLLTHRLCVNWGHAVAVADTVAWLDEHGIPYRDLCFLGDKPQVGAHCYVDDAPHNVTALRSTGAEVIVFDQPYNRHMGGPRAITWEDVERLVVERLTSHDGAVQPPLPGLDHAAERLRRNVPGHTENSAP